MVIWPERSEDNLPVLVPLLLRGNSSGGRGGAIQVVDIKVDNADLRRWANGIPGLGGETDDVRTRIVDINLGISGVNGRESNTIPAAKFNNVLDGHDRNLFWTKFSETAERNKMNDAPQAWRDASNRTKPDQWD